MGLARPQEEERYLVYSRDARGADRTLGPWTGQELPAVGSVHPVREEGGDAFLAEVLAVYPPVDGWRGQIVVIDLSDTPREP